MQGNEEKKGAATLGVQGNHIRGLKQTRRVVVNTPLSF